MAISVQDFRMAIRIDNSEAKQSLVEMKSQIQSLRDELRKMSADGKKDSAEYQAKQKTLDGLNNKYNELRRTVGITGLTYNELRKGAVQLRAQLNNSIPGTEKWKQYQAELKITEARMAELRGQAVQTNTSLSKVATGFNKYATMAAAAVASFTGVTLAARKSVDDFAKLEEAEANVRKYTGMTRDEVKELNEEFKRMDTRTARVRLNELAADAGRLGIKGKQDLLDFADAANIINVSLGEDLGEDAVKNIGKLAQMFGDDQTMGLKGAMLATASAINEVAQNSSAAEPYLVGFTARIAGTAKQAGISQAQIIGYASALDQDMQQLEMSATALQKVIMKMYQEPAMFAKMAGKDVKEFTKLMREDANEAVLQLLESLGKKGGLSELSPIFKDMKLDGVRAAGVLNNLAANVNKVRAEQERANEAYRAGTSVVNEYNIKNTTLQATIEKAKKGFQEVSYELGEKLAPHMSKVITTGGTLVRVLAALVGILFKYGGMLAFVGGALLTYIALEKLIVTWTGRHTAGNILNTASLKAKQLQIVANTAAEKLYAAAIALSTGRLSAANRMLKAFFATLKIHPIAAVITAVLALGAGIYKLATRTSEAQKAMRSFFEQNDKEQRELKKLIDVTKIAGDGTKRRKDLIDEINTKYGQYLPNLLTEYSSLKDIEQAYKDINVAMEKNIAKKVMDEKIGEIQTEGVKEQGKELLKIRSRLEKVLPESQIASVLRQIKQLSEKGIEAGYGVATTTDTILNSLNNVYGVNKMSMEKSMKDFVESVDKTNKKVKEIKKEMTPFLPADKPAQQSNVLPEVEIVAKDLSGGNGGDDMEDKELKKFLQKREEELKNAMQAERNLWKEDFMNKKVTEEEYNQALFDTEEMFLLSKKALLEKYKQDSSQVQGQIYDKMIAEANRIDKARKDAEKKAEEERKKARDSELKDLDSSHEADRIALKQMYLNGEIKSEKEFQAKMKELEADYLQSRLRTLEKYGEDVGKVTEQIADRELADQKEQKDKDKAGKEKELAGATTLDGKLGILQAMYDADLISYEEYEKLKSDIAEEYEKQRYERAKATFEVIGQAASAASDVVNALMDREISKVNTRYDKQIKAAKKAGRDTTKLEEAKEEEINAIKKKYADKQFMAAVLQVTATTAVAAMEAYKAMAGIPIIGPALGAVAAAAAIASGAAQISIAKQQRDEAKGLYSGGFSDEYVDGYTASGNPRDVAGVIPIHKNEFVANHEGVGNPHVRQFLDVFDVAQKNGTIRMINTTQILEQVRTRSGKYSGGYNIAEDAPGGTSSSGWESGNGQVQVQRVISLLQESNRLLLIISEKELNIDGRAMRDRIRTIDQLERNVSRRS